MVKYAINIGVKKMTRDIRELILGFMDSIQVVNNGNTVIVRTKKLFQ